MYQNILFAGTLNRDLLITMKLNFKIIKQQIFMNNIIIE